MSAGQRAESRFCVFAAPKWGFRALARDLNTKWRRGLTTLRGIVTVYAPDNENNTKAYVRAVAADMGVEPDVRIDLEDRSQLAALCRAIAVHESGGWFFSDGDLVEGVRLALGAGDATSA